MSKARAKRIKLVLFDVDGVMTDGKIWIFPAPGGGLVEAKGFHAQDGAGISLLRHAGIKTGLITKRQSETVALRARAWASAPGLQSSPMQRHRPPRSSKQSNASCSPGLNYAVLLSLNHEWMLPSDNPGRNRIFLARSREQAVPSHRPCAGRRAATRLRRWTPTLLPGYHP